MPHGNQTYGVKAVVSPARPQPSATVKGWTVEARQRVPSGSFVAEYLGEYVTNAEAQRRLGRYDALNKHLVAQKAPASLSLHADEEGFASADQLVTAGPLAEGDGPSVTARGWGGHALMASDPMG